MRFHYIFFIFFLFHDSICFQIIDNRLIIDLFKKMKKGTATLIFLFCFFFNNKIYLISNRIKHSIFMLKSFFFFFECIFLFCSNSELTTAFKFNVNYVYMQTK